MKIIINENNNFKKSEEKCVLAMMKSAGLIESYIRSGISTRFLNSTTTKSKIKFQEQNSAIRNCCISARGAIKLHLFGTSAELSEACMPKGCNFIAPQVLIQQLYY